MKKAISILLSLIIAIMPLTSLGATGHINGCTNTGYDTSCCTKTFKITPKTGYKVIDVIVNGVSKGALTEYTFTNITGPQSLEVKTQAIGNTLTVNPGKTQYTGEEDDTVVVTAPDVKYTVTYNYNGNGEPITSTTVRGTFDKWTLTGSGDVSSLTANPTVYTYGNNSGKLTASYIVDSVNLPTPQKSIKGYDFAGWGLSSTSEIGAYDAGSTYIPASNVTLYAIWAGKANKDTSGANAPVIVDGLTPVNWDTDKGEWYETTQEKWQYNYNSVAQVTQTTVAGNKDGAWANAKTADGSMYVWIPRYTYKIITGYHSSGGSWNATYGNNRIDVKFSNGITDDTSDNYIKHPAFTFGGDELRGIWVAKYEASQGTNTNTTSTINKPTATSYVAQSKPNEVGWGKISVSECYKYAYNTFRNADSHLMKNVEWGAVAYLASAVGKIPYINNHNGDVVGMAGENQSESNHNYGYEWNTQKGVKASTTHNVYGVYGMSGGLEEFVSAFVNKKYYDEYLINDTSGKYAGILYANKDTKYVDVYDNSYSSGKIGDAVYETSDGCRHYSEDSYEAWDGDMAYESDSYALVFQRGGDNLDASRAGIFAFCIYSPAGVDSRVGFRVVLAPQ